MELAVKNPPASAGDAGSIPGGNGRPLQYTCLENSMDRGAWWATVLWGHEESDMTEHTSLSLSNY